MITDLIDFDDIDNWAPSLGAALKDFLPHNIQVKIKEKSPVYVEDTLNILFDLADRIVLCEAALGWVRDSYIAAYHGTRLNDSEVMSVQTYGLLPLKAESRRERLVRALSSHPRWNEVHLQLDAALKTFGQEARAGRREGQVHLTLSRSGLVNKFNRYLTDGAEFDRLVAHTLLGDEGVELLRGYGVPRVIQASLRGDIALCAAHPFFSIEDILMRGDIPNIICDFLKSWSFKLAYPNFQTRSQNIDCGLVFNYTLSPECIVKIETVDI
jgi:hypothetical protein